MQYAKYILPIRLIPGFTPSRGSESDRLFMRWIWMMAFVLKVCLRTVVYAKVTEKLECAGYYSQLFHRLEGMIFFLGQFHWCLNHFYPFCLKWLMRQVHAETKFLWMRSMIFISMFLIFQEDNHLWDKILLSTILRRVTAWGF